MKVMTFTPRCIVLRQTRILFMLLLLTASLFVHSASPRQATPWQTWYDVGEAQLTWGPWVIYDSELRTPTGYYQDNSAEMALVIKYQRDIDQEDLLDATGEQWEHLGIPADKRRRWLARLAQIWPDVKKGERLIFVISNGNGVFYQDNRLIGILNNNEMSMAFLHIWLSPNTSYPNIRRKLIGKA